MTDLPADIADIAARHDVAYSDRRHSIVKAFKNAHNDRGALLRAYRELAEENERLTLERDEARGIKLAQLKAVVGERDRLRASHAKVFEAGWRTAATWAVRADLIFDIGSPAYLEDQAKALVDAQHPEQQPIAGDSND